MLNPYTNINIYQLGSFFKIIAIENNIIVITASVIF
jgi:hypothetical protein